MTTSEPTTKTCSRCGATFTGTIFLCEKCDAKSEGEYGVKFNEPTTGEIVRGLRCVSEETECKDCRYKYPVGNVILCDHERINGNAADRLESQEQTIAALTARAEQAERERDAAIKFIRTSDWCAGCENMKNLHCDFMKECANPRDLYKLRGLPQDGEGNK